MLVRYAVPMLMVTNRVKPNSVRGQIPGPQLRAVHTGFDE